MTALILTVTALGLVSGVSEGMVMILLPDWMRRPGLSWQDYAGVRAHRWFGAYHAIDLAAYGLCAALAVLLWVAWPGWCSVAGLAVLLWEAREIGYATARWGRQLPEHEHLTFADILSVQVKGRAVRLLHGARLLTAIVLLIIGGLK